MVLEDQKKIKEAENQKKHYIEHPWAMGFQKDKKDQDLLNLKNNKDAPVFLENKKPKKLHPNYSNFDDFIEFKPKRYLKTLENDKIVDFSVEGEDENKNATNVQSKPFL